MKTINDQIRSLDENYKWKIKVLERDNYTCKKCKIKRNLSVIRYPYSLFKILKKHKITNLSQALLCKPIWNIQNGITICQRCRYGTKKYYKWN